MGVSLDGVPYPERSRGSESTRGTEPNRRPQPSRGRAEPEDLPGPVASCAVRSLSRWPGETWNVWGVVPETTPRRVIASDAHRL